MNDKILRIEIRRPATCSGCGELIRPQLRVPRVNASLIELGDGTYVLTHPTQSCEKQYLTEEATDRG